MAATKFQTTIDPDQYFKGLARQTLDFQHALGELIDNAMSARKLDQYTKNPILVLWKSWSKKRVQESTL